MKSALLVLPLESQVGTVMPEVSPDSGGAVPRGSEGGLCQSESGSGAPLGAAIASLTGCLWIHRTCSVGPGVQRWSGVQRREWVPIGLVRWDPCCVLSKSDSAVCGTSAEDGFCAWWMAR